MKKKVLEKKKVEKKEEAQTATETLMEALQDFAEKTHMLNKHLSGTKNLELQDALENVIKTVGPNGLALELVSGCIVAFLVRVHEQGVGPQTFVVNNLIGPMAECFVEAGIIAPKAN